MNDVEILADACWGLSYISDATNDKIQAILESGVCGKLVQLLQHTSTHVVTPALRTVGNIVTGDDIQTQCVLNNNALPHIYSILVNSHSKNLKREACWTVSNITAGNQEQIQAIINANIIAPILSLLSTAEFHIKKEAAWAISNATLSGTCEQIRFIVSQGCINGLCDLLTCPDPRILAVCLDSLANILKAGEFEKNRGNPEGINMYARLIENADGLEKIEALQTHENADIYKSAVNILENYFVDDEDQSQPMADTESNYPSGTPSFVGEGGNHSGYHLL